MSKRAAFRWAGLAAQIAIGIGVLFWLIRWGNVDLGGLLAQISSPSLVPLGLGVLCFAATAWAGAVRYLLFCGPGVSPGYMTSIVFLQGALVTFVPWRVGEAGYPLFLRRDHGVPVAAGASAVLAVRLADLFVLLVVALAGAARMVELDWVPLKRAAAAMLLGAILILLVVRAWQGRAPRALAPVLDALKPLSHAPKLAGFAALTMLILALRVLQAKFVFAAVGLPMTLPDIAILVSLTLLSTVFPVHPPGGWGTLDSIQVLILVRLGHAAETCASPVLATHAVYTLLILIGGIAGWFGRRAILAGRPPLEKGGSH